MTFDPKKYKEFRVSNWGHSDPVYKKVAKQQKVTGGVCRGMCLDWSRRILLGKSAPHEKNGAPVDKEKARKRYAKQIELHRTMNDQVSVPGYFENTLTPLAQKEADLLRLQALCAQEARQFLDNQAEFQRRRDGGDMPSQGELLPHLKMLNRLKSRQGYTEKVLPYVQDNLRQLGQEISDIETYLDRKFPEMFASFQVAWTKNPKTGGFTSITASRPDTTTETRRSYTRGEDVWRELIVPFLLSLEGGDCALVQAGSSASKEPGHAIAFHVTTSGAYCFFDPNFGEFRFEAVELDDMERFFKDLWDWNYARYTWVSLVRLRHSNGSATVAAYDPITRKVKGGTTCTVM